MIQSKIYTWIQKTNPVSNERNVIKDIQTGRCILCVLSVFAAVELLPELFLFGPTPLGEPFPFLCLLRGFFFTPFGFFPTNRKQKDCLIPVK
jgi:hypothetical protein